MSKNNEADYIDRSEDEPFHQSLVRFLFGGPLPFFGPVLLIALPLAALAWSLLAALLAAPVAGALSLLSGPPTIPGRYSQLLSMIIPANALIVILIGLFQLFG